MLANLFEEQSGPQRQGTPSAPANPCALQANEACRVQPPPQQATPYTLSTGVSPLLPFPPGTWEDLQLPCASRFLLEELLKQKSL